MTIDWMQDAEPVVSALGRTLVDFLWQGALVTALYALARALLHGTRARLFAGHIALLALGTMPLLTLVGQLSSPQPAAIGAVADAHLPEAVLAAVVSGIGEGTVWRWHYWLVAGWAAGVTVLSLRLWTQWRRLRHLCRSAVPLGPAWQARFEALKRRLGVRWRVGLRAGTDIAVPMLIGVLRPTILLPAALLARLPADQVELVLLHELVHLRRFDPLLNLVQTAIVTVLFYHPAVHWIARKVDEDRELRCDEEVMTAGGDRLLYARVLVTLAEAGMPQAPGPALAATGGVLLERVERIVEVPRTRGADAQGVVALALATLLALMWWLPAREPAAMRWMAPAAILLPDSILRLQLPDMRVPDITMSEAPSPQLVATVDEGAALRFEPLRIEPAAPTLAFASAVREVPETWRFTPADIQDLPLRVLSNFAPGEGADAFGPARSQAAQEASTRCTLRTGTHLCSSLRSGARKR